MENVQSSRLQVQTVKKFKCKHCNKKLASRFSAQRHILSAHNNRNGDDNQDLLREENIEIEYADAEKLVPKNDEDKVIQKQQQQIYRLKTKLEHTQKEIKFLRKKLKQQLKQSQ